MAPEPKIFGFLRPWTGIGLGQRQAIAEDLHVADFPKGGAAEQFTSIWALYHAALSESDSTVISHVSRGMSFPYQKTSGGVAAVVPDALVTTAGGTFVDWIVDPGEELDFPRGVIQAIECNGLSVRKIDRTSIVKKIVLAKNWMRLTRWLVADCPTDSNQLAGDICDAIRQDRELSIVHLLSFLNLEHRQAEVITVVSYCLWLGKCRSDIDTLPFSLATKLRSA